MFTTIICSDTNEISYTYEEYLLTKHWIQFRNNYIEKFGNLCESCGEKGEQLHHLHYDTLGNEDFDDVMFLCNKCHKKEYYIK